MMSLVQCRSSSSLPSIVMISDATTPKLGGSRHAYSMPPLPYIERVAVGEGDRIGSGNHRERCLVDRQLQHVTLVLEIV